MATRDQINEAMRTMLATGSSRPIGLIDPPNISLAGMPYGVLMPGVIGPGEGSMDDAEGEDHDYIFTVINVGKDHRQAAAMSSRTHIVMTTKVGSEYVHPVSGLIGHAVTQRVSDSRGPVVRSGTLYQCSDNYRIRVSRSG